MKNPIFDEIPELVRLSSKGQLVIPQDIRNLRHIKEGSVFAISSPNEDVLILKRVTNPLLQEDLEILKDVESAWEDIKEGKYKESSKDDFLKELAAW